MTRQTIYRNKERLFDLWAPSYDCLLTTVFYQAIHKRMLEFAELPESPNVLDLGCGTGRLLDRLASQYPNLQGTGLDLSSEMLQQARQRNRHGDRITFEKGNTESLPFEAQTFDAAFNTISFLHYPDPEGVLMEVKRVLRPQGRFYLADYTVRDDWRQMRPNFLPQSPNGLHFYSPQQREHMGIVAGLECLGHHYLLGPILLTVFGRVNV
jgi:ubiquinone/menaquinone biosynthesis C-methylase UbiE